MPQHFILMVMGGVFLLLGLVLFFWSRSEEKGYNDILSGRPDVREYLEHEPNRPEPGSLKVGAWTAIAVGLVLLALGGSFWFWG